MVSSDNKQTDTGCQNASALTMIGELSAQGGKLIKPRNKIIEKSGCKIGHLWGVEELSIWMLRKIILNIEKISVYVD